MLRSALLFALVLFTAGACRSTAPVRPTAEVVYVGQAEPGTLTVRSAGYGDGEAAAVRRAEESAFQALLFRGIPGSTQERPLVGDPGLAGRYADYFDALIGGGRYATFVTQSGLAGEPDRAGGLHRAVVVLTINQHALRRDLEQHGVIRTFGL